MREQIHYARCVCDFCEKEEHIADSLIRPKGWEKIRIENAEFDLCESCLDKVKTAIDEIMRSTKLNEHLTKLN